MYRDKIVSEVRKTRNKIESEVGGSISMLHKYFMTKQSITDQSRIKKLPKNNHKIKSAA